MDDQKRSEVLAFFWFIISFLTLLALATYTPDDIPFEISLANSPARNIVGPVGAYTAWVLVLLFGRTSYFLVPLFLFWSFAKWSGKKSQKAWLKIFSTILFLTSACALFSLIGQATEINRFYAGGIIGFFISNFLNSLFGNAGMFVALSLFLLSILLATELLVLQIATGLVNKMKKWLLPVLEKIAEEKRAARGEERGTKIEKPKEDSRRVKEDKVKPLVVNSKFNDIKENLMQKVKAEVKPPAEPIPSKPQIKLSIPKPVEPNAEKPIRPVSTEDLETPTGTYTLPPLELLQTAPAIDQTKMASNLEESSRVLEDTLKDFGIEAKVVEVEQGPTITRYELQPAAGVKVQKITSLENDISLAMRATSVRIVAPIPGKSRVGIEVPNSATSTVYIKDVLQSGEFRNEKSKISIVIGKDTAGAPLVCNLADMPHLLIAGATNTGKSVCINSIISSILFKSTPEEVKFLMIDPKMVELHFYNDLPHLICPVVTDKTKAPSALAWLLGEMERRYKVLSKVGAKNILSFNEKVDSKSITLESLKHTADNSDEPVVVKKMPYIVLIIDELADLMMSSANEVETSITRLAQLARAVGIHMILATQRPSVDVITGVIKANFPARIAFQVASKVDSRTILDENGADKLLGRGDLLLMDPRKSKLVRAQGAWVQDAEIEKITQFIKSQRKAVYLEGITQAAEKGKQAFGEFKRDEVYDEAKRVVLETGQASVSMVQRRLGLGYTRAARLIDMMEEDGVVGPYRGAKPREILVERSKQNVANTEVEKEKE
jgi:DNA segregation ATPase FtsK/SpoIIIE, S-DNA-T family